MKVAKMLRRSLGAALKKAPAPVQAQVRRAWKATRTLAGKGKPVASAMPDTATLLAMKPEHIGTTYETDEILPMLALENHVLYEQLDAALSKVEYLRAVAKKDQSHDVSAEEQERRMTAAALAEEYLAGQPDAQIRHLVVANDYPRPGKEYGNGFVHRRVKHYLASGVAVDVVCAGYSVDHDLFEYDGVRVLSGKGQEIDEVLKRQRYTSVSCHFMNPLIWRGLEPHLADIDLHVFLHGYECSRWIRRVCNYQTGTELERALNRSVGLRRFWRQIVEHPYQPKSYIFVSNWWRDAVSDDMGIVFPAHRTHVVHNYINADLFAYQPKDPAQRFRILWVRTASQRNYGHDLAIQTLQRLARSKYWPQCEVTIIGDGKFFPDFEKSLGTFSNVRIEQRFATQEEIAELHKSHGIFLVPTRLDTQGVSRDEAMSSGLVVATNGVAAVPEFVDNTTGIVAEAERADQLAAGIMKLWEHPERFTAMATAAAERVHAQCGRAATVDRELHILGIG